jgi:deoxycytidine triphosphate deaminase
MKVLELNDFLINHNKRPLIANLCDRELNNPEGCGFDMRVGEVYELSGKGFLGVSERETPNDEKIADVVADGNKTITMKPGEYFLVKTMEEVSSPMEKLLLEEGMPLRYLMPVVFPRTTLQNSGIALLATKTDPGYYGSLRFGLTNLRNEEFSFELGARMFNIVFEPVIGEIGRGYEGQWQGGKRAGTNGIETQI